MEITIGYVQNTDTVKHLNDSGLINLTNVQNYMPLYNRFFKLNNDNFNYIHLNNSLYLSEFKERRGYNKFLAKLKDDKKDIHEKEIFIKFAPIIDPFVYMTGKYDISGNLFALPSFNSTSCHEKTMDENNASYIDAFFSFLLGKINQQHGVVNALNHYGTFLANFEEFKINIYDDMELLADSKFFAENVNKLFTIDDYFDEYMGDSSRKNREPLKIIDSIELGDIIELDDSDIITTIPTASTTVSEPTVSLEESCSEAESDHESRYSPSNSSTCSSRNSTTDEEEEETDDEDWETESEDEEDMIINAYIPNFPVAMVMLEQCQLTLDEYMTQNNLSDEEWQCIFLQIIFQLIIYQKMFDFTHNDLHTNNVMYVETNKEFVNYFYDGSFYKVPTFGKIWKIIDFGRAIFRFKKHIFCSDSFHPKGDAAGQYNCQPYFNSNKPTLEPNMSFDLCRLGCSLFDHFFSDIQDAKSDSLSSIEKLVVEWCTDDNNKNILYKSTGEERYPEFKLYKMIARLVHHCTPQKQLKKPVFEKYCVPRKKISKKQVIMNIDLLPKYF